MTELIASLEFWVGVVLAMIIKFRASPKMRIFAVFATVAGGVLSALVFTPPVLDWLDLEGEIYTAATAAIVGLSAEHMIRQILDAKIIDLIKAWRGLK